VLAVVDFRQALGRGEFFVECGMPESTIEHNRAEWERNAQADALWAILTDRERASKTWNLDEFFQTGRTEIANVFRYMESAGIPVPQGGCFLDFGCGVGRISRALMPHFDSGFGIDISDTMIELARQYSANDSRRPTFIVNKVANLAVIPDDSVDFAYSHIVIQHIPKELQAVFIGELLRPLRPGGIAAFQVPTENLASRSAGPLAPLKSLAKAVLPGFLLKKVRTLLGRGTSAELTMEMNVVPVPTIEHLLRQHRCELLAAPYTNSAETSHRGDIRFMSRDAAVAAVRNKQTDTPLLSQFFFARKKA
jgi:SAM-dependent methyltransferase